MYLTKKLSEVWEIITWNTPSKAKPEFWWWEALFVKPPNLWTDKIVTRTEETLSDLWRAKWKLIKKDSIMVCCIWSLWKIGIAWENVCTNQQINSIFFDDKIVNFKYWYYFCTTLEKLMNKIANKAIIAIINKTTFSEILIPLPPLSIQSRIVARLDSAFASIDEQISLLRTNIVDVENIRKSVLFDFFWWKNQLLPLSDYVEKLSGIALPEIYKNWNWEWNIPFYKVWEMNNDGLIMKWATLFFNQELAQTYKIKVFPKWTIVFPKRWGAIFTEKKRILTEEASYDSNVMWLKANNKHLSDEYLFVFMKFIKLWDYADDAGIAQINNKHIDLMKIPLPPLPRQHEIVAHLDRVFVETTALRGEYEAQIRDLGTLKQSLLEEAFAGRLVPEEDEA